MNLFVSSRRLRRSWWWWWCSASPGCLTTWSTCGWSSGPSRSTRPPSCSGSPPTAWHTATRPSTPSSTPSCRRTSARPTSRCSAVSSAPATRCSRTSRRCAARQTPLPPPTAPTFEAWLNSSCWLLVPSHRRMGRFC